MELFASGTCTSRRVTCILNRLVGSGGVLEVCQATALAQFHVHVLCNCFKLKLPMKAKT